MRLFAETSSAPLPRWRFLLAYAFALFAAGVLVLAAFLKAGDPALFADQITAHRVTPASWSTWLAFLFIAVELILGAALIAFVWPRLSFAFNILLMLGFIGVTAYAWKQGNLSDCGCFGRMIERGPKEVIIEDALVIATSLAGLWLVRGYHTPAWRPRLFAALLVPALALVAFGTALPLDRIVVGIGPGSDLSRMTSEGLPFALDEGRTLVALVGADCAPCDAGVASLAQTKQEEIVPQVAAIFAGKPGQALAWRLQHQPNFPVGSSPERVLRQYYRRLPSTFLLDRGVVMNAWWGRIPSAEEVRAASAQVRS
ncbi:MAG: hypothetical protein KBD56_09470 [Candidatus Eisenbacteria bacterium]|nr:hypothetical protein [Candidatus Eisenbacteria bacterium]